MLPDVEDVAESVVMETDPGERLFDLVPFLAGVEWGRSAEAGDFFFFAGLAAAVEPPLAGELTGLKNEKRLGDLPSTALLFISLSLFLVVSLAA